LGAEHQGYNYGKSAKTLLKNGNSSYWDTQQFQNIFVEQPNIITIMLGPMIPK